MEQMCRASLMQGLGLSHAERLPAMQGSPQRGDVDKEAGPVRETIHSEIHPGFGGQLANAARSMTA